MYARSGEKFLSLAIRCVEAAQVAGIAPMADRCDELAYVAAMAFLQVPNLERSAAAIMLLIDAKCGMEKSRWLKVEEADEHKLDDHRLCRGELHSSHRG